MRVRIPGKRERVETEGGKEGRGGVRGGVEGGEERGEVGGLCAHSQPRFPAPFLRGERRVS